MKYEGDGYIGREIIRWVLFVIVACMTGRANAPVKYQRTALRGRRRGNVELLRDASQQERLAASAITGSAQVRRRLHYCERLPLKSIFVPSQIIASDQPDPLRQNKAGHNRALNHPTTPKAKGHLIYSF